MDADALLARYEAISKTGEVELANTILQQGWEAGCWFRTPSKHLILDEPDDIARILESVGKRASIDLQLGEDPHPDGLPQTPITGTEPCLVVVSQKCDLVTHLKAEPFVELAPARHTSSKDAIKGRWKNSSREFPVDPGADETFLVDLRYRYYLPRMELVDLPAQQALRPDDETYRTRFRFGLRVGQRYGRAAVPDALVQAVVVPLGKILKDDSEANKFFMEWMLHHGGRRSEKPGLIALYGVEIVESEDADEQRAREVAARNAAEDKYEEIVTQLPQTAQDALDLDNNERSGAFDEADLSVAKWAASWKLDFDAATFSGESPGATPTR
jgi:hypothetical protein